MSGATRRKMRIKKGDIVIVTAGAEKGKRGKVIEAIPSEGRVLIEKVNIIKRHQRPTQQQRQGGIIEREGKLSASNVQIFCSKCDRAVKMGVKKLKDGKKVRICRKCGDMLDLG